MARVFVAGLCFVLAHGVVDRTSHKLISDNEEQFGLPFPSSGLSFSAVKAKSLMKIEIDRQSDADAKSVAFEGATTMMVSANLKSRSLRLIPGTKMLEAGEVGVAWAKYNNTVKQNGWAQLSITATKDSKISRDVKMYAAGFLEGYVSAQQIRDFQHNANELSKNGDSKHNSAGNIFALFEKEANNIAELGNMKQGTTLSEANAPADPWWRQARYALLQSWGMLDAYNQQVDRVKGTAMSMIHLLILNSDGETPELQVAYDAQEVLLRESQKDDPSYDPDSDDTTKQSFLQRTVHHKPNMAARKAMYHEQLAKLDDKVWRKIKRASGRCSALVRLTKDNSDLMVGHTTFSDYSEMNRIFKYYDLPLGDGVAQKIGFSSYPGVAGSTDDYYLMDTGLAVTETTISMLTDEPYDKLDDNATSVPDFMRIMLANRLARTSEEWVNYLKKSSTGTYSSQWMVVDYNKFKPGEPLKNGTLFVIEQVPGISHIQDASAFLQEQRYWGSENRAWFQDVMDSIGQTEAEEAHGALFSRDKNPRANIFHATAPTVETIADMRHEMQRNRWPNEPDGGFPAPDHAIAARGDLDKSDPDPNGGVDAKITNFCLAKQLKVEAISGPTHDHQKVFRWTDEKTGKQLFPKAPHDGMPDVWNFDWVRMSETGAEKSSDSC